jgi:hypothetical protein
MRSKEHKRKNGCLKIDCTILCNRYQLKLNERKNTSTSPMYIWILFTFVKWIDIKNPE